MYRVLTAKKSIQFTVGFHGWKEQPTKNNAKSEMYTYIYFSMNGNGYSRTSNVKILVQFVFSVFFPFCKRIVTKCCAKWQFLIEFNGASIARTHANRIWESIHNVSKVDSRKWCHKRFLVISCLSLCFMLMLWYALMCMCLFAPSYESIVASPYNTFAITFEMDLWMWIR